MTTDTIPHGTVTGNKYHHCKCLDCCNAYAKYQAKRYRQMGYGTWQPLVDATPAREHIEQLNAAGMSWEQIARQGGISSTELRRLRMPLGSKPRTERIRPDRAAMLLAITFTPQLAPKGMLPSLGAARRLQALRTLGWPLSALAARSEVARHTLATVPKQPYVQQSTHARIVDLFDDLHDQDPLKYGVSPDIVERAKRWAAARGWVASNRWHGDIDDPNNEPGPALRGRFATGTPGSRRQTVIEDTAELLSQGCTPDVIAQRLGIKWDTIQQMHRRAGVTMPEVAA